MFEALGIWRSYELSTYLNAATVGCQVDSLVYDREPAAMLILLGAFCLPNGPLGHAISGQ